MSRNRIASCMALKGDTQSDLAVWLGISRSRLNAKINGTGGAEFTQSEMIRVAERYDLSPEEAGAIFFAKEVS